MGGNSIKLSSALKIRNNKLINYKPKVNMNIYNKHLILEIQSQIKDFQKTINITPWGIEGSSKMINYEEGCSIHFGCDSGINQVRKIIYHFLILQDKLDFILPVYKSIENTYETEPNSELKNYDKNEGIFFKIQFDFFNHKYYLKDMGSGFGTYIKIDNRTIKENTIINIGDSFLIFSYQIYLNFGKDKKSNNHKLLLLKIYNREGESQPIILGKNKELYTIGRAKDADVPINDITLSRINCFLYYKNGIWEIQDGNQNGEYSTNGTWIYALEETEIVDNMIFKSNKFNFHCKFSFDLNQN